MAGCSRRRLVGRVGETPCARAAEVEGVFIAIKRFNIMYYVLPTVVVEDFLPTRRRATVLSCKRLHLRKGEKKMSGVGLGEVLGERDIWFESGPNQAPLVY